jgi:3-hydroxybutyryl-CoA dehydrogenase
MPIKLWTCKKCGAKWRYHVDKCIRCGLETEVVIPKKYIIRGITEVFTPSSEHPEVPYYDLFLEDEYGNFHIRKSIVPQQIGKTIDEKTEAAAPILVGIVGTGVMGVGIAEVMIKAGNKVILKSRSEEKLRSAVEKIEKYLLKSMSIEEKNEALSRLRPTTSFQDLADADIVIEAVVEDLDIKKEVFKKLDAACGSRTILATTTSFLSISEIGSATSDSSKVIGMHFFNPAPKMRLVEIIRGDRTSQETIKFVAELAMRLNKVPVIVNDSPGFVVNRLLIPYLNEAVTMLEKNIADYKDIDTAVRLGLNHPMGPFELLDLIGLDTFLAILNSLYEKTHDPMFLPSSRLKSMVECGKLGRKTGEGFYEYK